MRAGIQAAARAVRARWKHTPDAAIINACATLRGEWRPGDLMLIDDHSNLLGDNPLVGPNDDRLRQRFPDMSQPYDGALRASARAVARRERITLREGVYAAVTGPNLERRAEYRMLRTVGADVGGMSTLPEVIVAMHGGMRVLGISIVTDVCVPETLSVATLDAIIMAAAAEPALSSLARGVIGGLPA